MEENNNNETMKNESQIVNSQCKCNKETIGMLLAAFLGGFLAIYFVADQAFARTYNPMNFSPEKIERQMMKDFNKMYELEKKAFERDFGKFDMDFSGNFEKKSNKLNFPDKWFDNKHHSKLANNDVNSDFWTNFNNNGIKIKSEMDNDEYKVIIGLKAFNGDENKINYNVSGRKLTVFGNSNVKDKNFEQNISFTHDFILPSNADISKIKKEKDGDVLTIEVPLKN